MVSLIVMIVIAVAVVVGKADYLRCLVELYKSVRQLEEFQLIELEMLDAVTVGIAQAITPER
jgi:hypothetical protein